MVWHLQRLIATALVFAPVAANAGFPCPQTTIGWALSWPGPLTSAAYDSASGLLFITFYGTRTQAFSNVPLGIMQSLSYTQNPIAIYNSTLIPSYHQILLTEKDHCPLQWEYQGTTQGYLWTD